MLDMGFYEDIIKIVKNISAERQTLLFSATMPPRIRQLAKNIMKDPEELNIAIAKPAENITQEAYMTYEKQKEPMLLSLLSDEKINSAIVFASRKHKVKDLFNALKKKGVNAEAFHSDLDQETRERIMRSFKSRNTRILVGTDVISRGIDVEGIDLVVNYDVPPDPEDYVHRVGRTARAERKGHAVTFINEDDIRKFQRIESLIGYEINKPSLPGDLGEGPEYQLGKSSSKRPFKGKKGHGKKRYHRNPKGNSKGRSAGKSS
jgi:superfamily II DNA/RNA helicase